MSSFFTGDTQFHLEITGQGKRPKISFLICVIMFSGNVNGCFSESAQQVKLCITRVVNSSIMDVR